MKFVCTILILFSVYLMNAQSYNADKVNPKATRLYAQGLQEASDGNYNAGIRLVLQAIKIDTLY
ncbi:MAG TPA: hypothetical protein VKI61_15385, partial [Chitinophagaceae bacterium]|nr:hypothetical protein [Chitinophagaceae bacterium]